MANRHRTAEMVPQLTPIENIASPPSPSPSLSSSSTSSSPQRTTPQNKTTRKKHTTSVAPSSKWSKQKGRDEFSSNEDLATCAEGNWHFIN